jgi:hypothetical protein
MQDKLDMAGHFSLVLTDRSGAIRATRQNRNRIVKTGRDLVAQLFAGPSGPPVDIVSHMGVGSGAAEPADTDTDLGTPRAPRKAFSAIEFIDFDEVVGPDTIQRERVRLTAQFDFDEANNPAVPLREAAIFNAETGGVMYNRVVFQEVTKTDAFQLTLQWDVIF